MHDDPTAAIPSPVHPAESFLAARDRHIVGMDPAVADAAREAAAAAARAPAPRGSWLGALARPGGGAGGAGGMGGMGGGGARLASPRTPDVVASLADRFSAAAEEAASEGEEGSGSGGLAVSLRARFDRAAFPAFPAAARLDIFEPTPVPRGLAAAFRGAAALPRPSSPPRAVARV
jgi:hypothetical protein